VSIYRLLLVCLFFLFVFLLCLYGTDFFTEDKASSVKFCLTVHRRPRQGITNFGKLCFPRSPKSDDSASALVRPAHVWRPKGSRCEHRIGICGYKSVPTDVVVELCDDAVELIVRDDVSFSTVNSIHFCYMLPV